MMHPGLPSALSPRAMAGLRGAPVSGLGIVPNLSKLTPTLTPQRPAISAGPAAAGAAAAAPAPTGFKAKALKREDLLLLRREDEVEFCAEKPGAPGLRPRVCRVIDDAAVRLKSDGNDALKMLTYLSGAPEGKAISSLPYDMYQGATGSIAEEYAALYATAKYSNMTKTDAPNASQSAIPLQDLVGVMEEASDAGARFFDTKTVNDKLYASVTNQQLAWEAANRQQLDKETADKTLEERRVELESKTKKDDEARQQEAAKAEEARKQMLLLVGGGVVAVGVMAFVFLRR
jgi:hypothetical protein